MSTVAFVGPVGVGKTALIGRLGGVEDALVGEDEHRTGRTLAPHEVVVGDVGLLDLPGTVSPLVVAALAAADAHVLCVAVDEGVTDAVREHAELLAALDVVVAAVCGTRADLAPARLEGVAELPCINPSGTAVLATSARDGLGVGGVVAAAVGGRRALGAGAAVLHVEGVEEVPGVGVAVVGGLLRGGLRVGDAVHLLPAWHEVTVGALRVRGVLVEEAVAGDRVVVRVDGVAGHGVSAGDALVGADAGVRRTQVLDVSFGERVRLAHGSTVEVFAGARGVAAEVGWLGGRFHQLRVQGFGELLVAPWDRVVVRAPEGLVGGDVLDPAARRHGPSREVLAELARLARERPAP